MTFLKEMSYLEVEAQEVGKETLNDAEPKQSEIRPIVVESPQNDEGGRGLATNSGETPKAEA